MSPSLPGPDAENASRIEAVAAQEEESFLATLRTGSVLFDRLSGDLRGDGIVTVPGDAAFLLHDTYGFPIDLTLEMAREQGLQVDEAGFRRLMEEQRQRAKRDTSERKSAAPTCRSTARCSSRAAVTDFPATPRSRRKATTPRPGRRRRDRRRPPARATEVEIALDRTPFYAESGGQLADHGQLVLSDGSVVEVYDAQRPVGDLIVHRGRVRRRPDQRRRRGAAPRSTSSAARRSRARTRRPTWCTRRSGARSASTRPRPDRRTTPAGSGSTSPRRPRFRTACSPTSRPRSTTSCWPTWPSAPSSRPRTRRASSARWRCSARSTARRYASSRSATTPASSAAARTRCARPSSAWSSC